MNRFGNYSLVTRAIKSAVDIHRSVPTSIIRPNYAQDPLNTSAYYRDPNIDYVKTPKQIEGIRKACQLAAQTLSFAKSLVRPRISTDEIDAKVHDFIISRNAYPSPLLFQGFPKSICTSVNNVVVHGIPDERLLEETDIINIDVSVFLEGFHGDCSATFLVSDKVDEKGKRLVSHTKKCLELGIEVCGHERPMKLIGNTIEEYSIANGYSVNEDYCGHGIGENFHEFPIVLHTRNKKKSRMLAGMVFTIEPICNQGSKATETWEDEWTIVTKDGGRSAQFEHTVLITSNGAEILTKMPDL